MFSTLVFIFLVCGVSFASSTQDRTVVMTTNGPIRGKLVDDLGVTYYAYQGIPYAENPTGPLRFKPPVPRSAWTEVRDATRQGSVCYQPETVYKRSQMSEDCLFVNVFVPENLTEELLPVLVKIHSGEFKTRSGDADDLSGPQLLLKHNIIIVTFNYRLGALGYLSLDIKGASGNAGLKDSLLALKWIKANIERFGGDKNKITLGGNSSGSAMAHYLMLTTKSTGLFKRVILISGSALGYRFFTQRTKESALKLAKQLNISSNDPQVILEKLTYMDAFDIVQAQEDIGNDDIRKGFRPFAPFVPCAEIEYEEALITRHPREIIKAGLPQNLPILVGFNTDEGLKMIPAIRNNGTLLELLNDNMELCIPSDIEYPYNTTESKELAKMIRDFYFDGNSIMESPVQSYVDLVTDTMFSYNTDYWLKLHKDSGGSIVYYYLFGFDGQLNWLKLYQNISLPGAAHSDEIGYTFVTNTTRPRLVNLENLEVKTRRILDFWTGVLSNFVKFGNPTPENNDFGTIWEESGTQRNYLYVGDSIENQCGPPRSRFLQFWYEVYDKYYRYLESGGPLESKD